MTSTTKKPHIGSTHPPRSHVIAAYQASHGRFADLYEKLAKWLIKRFS